MATAWSRFRTFAEFRLLGESFGTDHDDAAGPIMIGESGNVHIVLETERLLLRRFTQVDVDNLVDLDSDPAVLRYINGGTPTPRDMIEREILPRFLRYYDRYDGYGFWAAIERTSGEFLGWFCLNPEDERQDRVALGYRLRRSAWGKGYATEGALALVRKGFTELGMRRVFAGTYEYNVASRRVMEKVGMKLVRVYRSTPEQLASARTFVATPDVVWPGNDVEYELARDEWERQHAVREVISPRDRAKIVGPPEPPVPKDTSRHKWLTGHHRDGRRTLNTMNERCATSVRISWIYPTVNRLHSVDSR